MDPNTTLNELRSYAEQIEESRDSGEPIPPQQAQEMLEEIAVER